MRKDNILTKRLLLQLVLIGLLLVPVTTIFGQDTLQHSIILTTNPANPDPHEDFYASETVYALVTLSDLEPGQYTATVNWVDPGGNINQYSTLSFSLRNRSPYTFHSWLRLMKNGPLKRTFSGRLFDEKYLGRWQLHIYINDVMLEKKTFTLH